MEHLVKTEVLQEAKIFGAAARIANADRKPAQDHLLLVLLDYVDLNQTEAVLRAWLNGWDYANQKKN